MNANRIFIALTAGLLGAPEERMAGAWRKAQEFCRLDASELQTGIGAAVGDGQQHRIALRTWVEQRRAEGVSSIAVATGEQPDNAVAHGEAGGEELGEDGSEEDGEDDGRAPHLMAGFAGGLPMLLNLVTDAGHASYVQGTVSGPRLLLTSQLLTRLVQCQQHPDFHWATVLSQCSQFRTCNGHAEIAPDSLIAHLSSQEGEREWQTIGDQVLREVQVEALTFDEPFVIPAEFQHLVEPVTPFDPGLEPCIWLDICDEDVTGAQLLQLVEAQGFSARVWDTVGNRRLLQDTLQDQYEIDDFPDIAAEDWPGYLAALSSDDAWQVADVLVEVVRLECERTGTQPVIPHGLEGVFGPDEEERRRLYFRHRLQKDLGWTIRSNSRPSMFYVLDRVDGSVPVNAGLPARRSKQEFIVALQAVMDFARHVNSPFVPSFAFALHLAAHAEGAGSPDLAAMRRGDCYRPAALWESVERIVALFAPFGWGADRLLGLAAISAADVFGGMGSWNDQGFTGDDDVRFHAVSAGLFAALNRYFDSIVSFEACGRVRA